MIAVLLYELEERSTDLALCFSRTRLGMDRIFIPRAQVHHISRSYEPTGGRTECAVTIPIWLARKHQLKEP